MREHDKTLGESLVWMKDQLNAEATILPKHKWRETFQANHNEYKQHDGKKFVVLADITDEALKDENINGYVRVYSVKLEDSTVIHAFEDEVEEFCDFNSI